MKGARSRQEQLARERIQALKNKRQKQQQSGASETKDDAQDVNALLETDDPIQLQVMENFFFVPLLKFHKQVQFLNSAQLSSILFKTRHRIFNSLSYRHTPLAWRLFSCKQKL